MNPNPDPPSMTRCPDSPRESTPAAGVPTNGRLPLGSGFFVLLALVVGIAGWLAWGRRDGGALAEARQAGVIRIGYAVEAPYAFLTPEGQPFQHGFFLGFAFRFLRSAKIRAVDT